MVSDRFSQCTPEQLRGCSSSSPQAQSLRGGVAWGGVNGGSLPPRMKRGIEGATGVSL